MIANVVSLREAREALHISASQIKTFLMCPEKYRHAYVLRTPPSYRPSALAFGSAVHETLATFYGHLMEVGEVMAADNLVETFESAWTGQVAGDDILFGEKESAEILADTGKAMLRAFHKDGIRPAEVIGVEVPFSIPVPGREEQMVGAFDLVARSDGGQTLIIEHKTAARRWSEDQLRWDIQGTVYAWTAAELGLGEVEIAYQVLLKTAKPAVAVHPVVRAGSDIDEMFKVVVGIMRAVEAEAFWPCRGWACATCQYAHVCGC